MPLPFLLASLLPLPAQAPAVRPADILPREFRHDPAVLTPRKHLGFDIGSRHLHHHQLVGYLRALARSSPRVRCETYGRSFGGRPLLLLTITSEENHRRLEEIRKRHLGLTDPTLGARDRLDDLPAVAMLCYGVHGNEPSASNVAPLVAYHLAAGSGVAHERLLREVVVLLDPCLNPDGFERFAQWANDNRGAVANPDPETREHREAWPGGRTNYYGFDLNRDWLPAQMPESRGRLAVYHRWKPNLVLDFHEMGTDSTYFFQPGAPRSVHPLIPPRNQELTRELARGHARALDRLGSLYFTGERFDDFYPGKGSTYPDLHGGVGILFEQASSRGQVQDNPGGRLSFPFTLRNQFATSLSSLHGLAGQRAAYLAHKRDFYRESAELARKGELQGHVVARPADLARWKDFLDVLHAHDIRVHRLNRDLEVGGQRFVRDSSVVLPAAQPEARFAQALFETRTTFTSRVFYDVSAWSLPLAFGLSWAPLDRTAREDILGERHLPGPVQPQPLAMARDDLAYLIDWQSSLAPRTVYRLLAAGVRVRAASRALEVFGKSHGTMLVPLGIQPGKRDTIVAILKEAARAGLPVHPVTSGLEFTPQGLGSSSFLVFPTPRVLMVTGDGVSGYDAADVWHLFDRRLRMPLTRVDTHRLGSVALEKYTVVVLPGGRYENVPPAAVERLREYVARGGTLVALGEAIRWLAARKLASVKLRSDRSVPFPGERRPYAAAEEDRGERLIRGAILKTRIDPTHPLCFGLVNDTLPVCRTTRVLLEPAADPYSSPVVYDKDLLLSGYVSRDNLEALAGSASVVVVPAGKGRAVLMADNPNFRAFWQGTSRLFVNAVFLGPILRRTAGE